MAQRLSLPILGLHAKKPQAARLGQIEPAQHPQQGRFSTAAFPNYRHLLPLGDTQGDILEDSVLAVVGERQFLSLAGLGRSRAGNRTVCLVGDIHHLKVALGGGSGPAHLADHVVQLAKGLGDVVAQRQESHQGAHRHRAPCHQHGAQQKQGHGLENVGGILHAGELLGDFFRLHLLLGGAVHSSVKLPGQLLLRTKGFDSERPLDGLGGHAHGGTGAVQRTLRLGLDGRADTFYNPQGQGKHHQVCQGHLPTEE